MPNVPLIIHERLGNWTRQLRPRLAGCPARVIDSRASTDLEQALAQAACPIVVIDLANRPRAMLEDLDRAVQLAPAALVLVLDPESHEGVPLLARELGATHVVSGVATPPSVARLLTRWVALAQRRAESDGWSSAGNPDLEPEPWNWLAPHLALDRPASSALA